MTQHSSRCIALSIALLLLTLAAASHGGEIPYDLYGEELRKSMHGHDRDVLVDWEPRLRERLQELRDGGADTETEAGIAVIHRLLDVPRLAIASEADLHGPCRVRSIQVDSLSVYVYPFFDCSLTVNGEEVAFNKPTGSQRRLGRLGRETPDRMLFVGGSYDQDELARGYSDADAMPEDVERDSVGYLFKIDPGHYVLVFAAKGDRHELYEVRASRQQ